MAVERVCLIGGSAGSVSVLLELLPAVRLGADEALLIVVHRAPTATSELAEVLQRATRIRLVEVDDKEPLCPGQIYLAPANYHLMVESPTELALSGDDPVLFSRPAIDVLFESAAAVFANKVRALVLTGASADGAKGMREVIERGGRGWVQAPADAEFDQMPAATLAFNPRIEALEVVQLKELLAHGDGHE